MLGAATTRTVSEIAEWSRLPDNIMRLSRGSDRTLHAKVYRSSIPATDYQAIFVGLVNLTGAVFNRGGNMETGFSGDAIASSRLLAHG